MVEEYAGSKGKFPPVRRRNSKSVYIATIEKAHSLVNSLIESGRMDSLGLLVVDEVGDAGSESKLVQLGSEAGGLMDGFSSMCSFTCWVMAAEEPSWR